VRPSQEQLVRRCDSALRRAAREASSGDIRAATDIAEDVLAVFPGFEPASRFLAALGDWARTGQLELHQWESVPQLNSVEADQHTMLAGRLRGRPASNVRGHWRIVGQGLAFFGLVFSAPVIVSFYVLRLVIAGRRWVFDYRPYHELNGSLIWVPFFRTYNRDCEPTFWGSLAQAIGVDRLPALVDVVRGRIGYTHALSDSRKPLRVCQQVLNHFLVVSGFTGLFVTLLSNRSHWLVSYWLGAERFGDWPWTILVVFPVYGSGVLFLVMVRAWLRSRGTRKEEQRYILRQRVYALITVLMAIVLLYLTPVVQLAR
jgi:hypothetical protein